MTIQSLAAYSQAASQPYNTLFSSDNDKTSGVLSSLNSTLSTAADTSAIQQFASDYSNLDTMLVNSASLFSDTSLSSFLTSRYSTVTPQVTYLDSVQSYLSTSYTYDIFGNNLDLFG